MLEKRKNKILYLFIQAILILFVILTSGYAPNNILNFHTSIILFVVTLILLFVSYKDIICKCDFGKFLLLLLFLTSFLLTYISSGGDLLSYGYYICILIVAMCISVKYEIAIIDIFIKSIVVISIISLFFYVLVNNFEISLPIIKNERVAYGNGWIFVYLVNDISRNCGVFWEPCLFAEYIIIALLFLIYAKKTRYRLVYIAVLLVTLFTTNSSTGIILLLLIVFLAFIHIINQKVDTFGFCVLTSFLLFLSLMILLNWDNIIASLFKNNKVVNKLLISNVMNSPRFIAIKRNLEIFYEHPFLGVGINSYHKLIDGFDSADTATLFGMMAKFGVFGFAYTLLIINFANAYGTNNVEKIIIFIILCIIVNSIPHYNILITWVLLFYALKNFNKNQIKENQLLSINNN